MKTIVVHYFVLMLILMILCIFEDLTLETIVKNPNWLKFLGFAVVVCFLAASLDVSYSEFYRIVKGAKPKGCFWFFLAMTVTFIIWFLYVIANEKLLVMSPFFMIKKVFPFLMVLYSTSYFSTSDSDGLIASFFYLENRKHLTFILNFLHSNNEKGFIL